MLIKLGEGGVMAKQGERGWWWQQK